MDPVQDFLLTPPQSAPRRRPTGVDRAQLDPRAQVSGGAAAVLAALSETMKRFAPITDANRAAAAAWMKQRHQELIDGWPPAPPRG